MASLDGNRQLTLDEYAAEQARKQPTGEELKEQGMERARKKAGDVWVGYASHVLRELCERQPTVWSDDLRTACQLTPASSNAWSAPWRIALKNKWIERTGRREASKRPESHGHLYDVYRSLIYRRQQAA